MMMAPLPQSMFAPAPSTARSTKRFCLDPEEPPAKRQRCAEPPSMAFAQLHLGGTPSDSTSVPSPLSSEGVPIIPPDPCLSTTSATILEATPDARMPSSFVACDIAPDRISAEPLSNGLRSDQDEDGIAIPELGHQSWALHPSVAQTLQRTYTYPYVLRPCDIPVGPPATCSAALVPYSSRGLWSTFETMQRTRAASPFPSKASNCKSYLKPHIQSYDDESRFTELTDDEEILDSHSETDAEPMECD